MTSDKPLLRLDLDPDDADQLDRLRAVHGSREEALRKIVGSAPLAPRRESRSYYVRIDRATHEALRVLAADTGVTMAEYVRRALRLL